MAKNAPKQNANPDGEQSATGAADPDIAVAAAAPDKPAPAANPLRPAVPGVVPSRAAERFVLPAIQQLHYSVVFPDAVPRPVEAAPGVFVNADGTPYLPRMITGGQYAALLLRVQGRFGGPTRDVGLPLATDPQHYPLKGHEKVVERIEVVFDFEDELQDFLAQYGTSNKDPLKMEFARKGLDPRLYDAEATSSSPFSN